MSNQNIWVFFELSDGRPKRVCLEMMQKAKALAEESSEKAVAVIIDPEPQEASKAAFENGADQVLVVRQKFFFESAAYILEKLAGKYEPKIVMIGATTEGRDLAASASARLHCGIASECTDVVITGSGVFWIRPSYDGRLNTNIGIEEAPMIGTFKPGIFKLEEPAAGRSGDDRSFGAAFRFAEGVPPPTQPPSPPCRQARIAPPPAPTVGGYRGREFSQAVGPPPLPHL